MAIIVQVLMYLVAAYVAIVGVVFFAQRSLMYPAGQNVASPDEVGVPEAREIMVTTDDGLSLRSWYIAQAPGRPVVVYFHGNAGTISDRAYKARMFADQGYGVLLVEYRGYGGNPGAPTESGLYQDGRTNLKWLARTGVPASAWVLYGESLGSGIAAQLAKEQADIGQPTAGLVLEAPFTSMADAAQHHYRFLPAGLLTRDRYETIAKIADIAAPLFIVHGTQDNTVPQTHGRRLFDAAMEPKLGLWLEHAGHNDVYDHGAGKAILDFLGSLPPIISIK